MFWEHFTPKHTVLEVTCIRVWTYSVCLQRCDFKHFLLREFKIEYIDIFLDSAWSNRLCQWQHACLHHPTDNYLSHALAMAGSNWLQERIIQDITSSQWTPCFHKNIVLLAELNTLLLGESRMILYLVNHWTDVCLRHYWLCMMLHEVGKTDAAIKPSSCRRSIAFQVSTFSWFASLPNCNSLAGQWMR